MHEPPESHSADRRRFLMLMGLACASTAVASPAATFAQSSPPPAPAPAPVPPPPSTEAAAIAEVVRIRYGKELSTAQIGAIAEDLDVRLEGGRELRKLRLENGQDPESTFHA